MWRFAFAFVLWLGLIWGLDRVSRIEQPTMGDIAQAELCLEMSDWVGEGQTWQFFVDPDRERLPIIMMVKVMAGEETVHVLESDIMASGPEAARPIGPTYRSRTDAQAAFVDLCQRLGRRKHNYRRPSDADR